MHSLEVIKALNERTSVHPLFTYRSQTNDFLVNVTDMTEKLMVYECLVNHLRLDATALLSERSLKARDEFGVYFSLSVNEKYLSDVALVVNTYRKIRFTIHSPSELATAVMQTVDEPEFEVVR